MCKVSRPRTRDRNRNRSRPRPRQDLRRSRPRPRLKKTGVETRLETETKSRDSITGVYTLSLDRHFRLWVNLLAFYDFLQLVSRNSGKGSLANGLAWGPRMPEQRYGKRAVNELRAMETYKKNKKIVYQLCLLLSNNNVDPKNDLKKTIEKLFQFDLDNDKS